jgi:hypothetical protein
MVLKQMMKDALKPTATGVMFMGNGKNRRRIARVKVKGTTFSGHPTRTTLGNTFRVICYHLYALWKTGHFSIEKLWSINKEFGILVSGDDMVGTIKNDYIP